MNFSTNYIKSNLQSRTQQIVIKVNVMLFCMHVLLCNNYWTGNSNFSIAKIIATANTAASNKTFVSVNVFVNRKAEKLAKMKMQKEKQACILLSDFRELYKNALKDRAIDEEKMWKKMKSMMNTCRYRTKHKRNFSRI